MFPDITRSAAVTLGVRGCQRTRAAGVEISLTILRIGPTTVSNDHDTLCDKKPEPRTQHDVRIHGTET